MKRGYGLAVILSFLEEKTARVLELDIHHCYTIFKHERCETKIYWGNNRHPITDKNGHGNKRGNVYLKLNHYFQNRNRMGCSPERQKWNQTATRRLEAILGLNLSKYKKELKKLRTISQIH